MYGIITFAIRRQLPPTHMDSFGLVFVGDS